MSMTSVSATIHNCRVRSLEVWVESFTASVVACERGLRVYNSISAFQNDAKTPDLYIPWSVVGFESNSHSATVTSLHSTVSVEKPVRVSFQYCMDKPDGSPGAARLLEVSVPNLPDTLLLLAAVANNIRPCHSPKQSRESRAFVLEAPSPWPLPDLTFYRHSSTPVFLSLYTPFLRSAFRFLSRFNLAAREMFMLSGMLSVTLPTAVTALVNNSRSNGLGGDYVVSHRWVNIRRAGRTVRALTALWITFQVCHRHLRLWHVVSRQFSRLIVFAQKLILAISFLKKRVKVTSQRELR
eukprot:PhM_4_TR11247/c0_g1_i1/m.15055